jgi:thiol-disulfide isomerase/thioredoxin
MNQLFNSGFLQKNMNSIKNLGWKTLAIIFIVLMFVILSIYYYYSYVKPLMKTTYKPNSEGATSSSQNQAELMLFYVDWCPHCKTAKPEWENVKSEYENRTINGYKVQFVEINCTEENPQVEKMINTYNIEGYPTIKLLKDGQVIDFDAKPTQSNLSQFLNTVL